MSSVFLFVQSWKYAGADRPKLLLHLFLHACSFSATLAQPYAFGRIIMCVERGQALQSSALLRWTAVYLGSFLVAEACHHAARYFEIGTALRTMQRFYDYAYRKVSRLPLKWHVNNHSGDTVDRINRAADSLGDFGMRQNEFLSHVFMSVGPLIALWLISWRIALATVVSLGLIAVVVHRLNVKIYPILRRQNETWHAFTARLYDYVSNIKTIITLRLSARTAGELSSLFDRTRHEEMAEFRVNQPRCALLNTGVIVTEIAMVLYSVHLQGLAGGTVQLGTLVTIFGYFRHISSAFSQIANTFYDTLHWRASLESMADIEQAEEFVDIEGPSDRSVAEGCHIGNVSFAYDSGHTVLDSFSLTLDAAESVALVGESGCGKSTLLSVLRGLHPAPDARVSVQGTPMPLAHISSSAVLVPQEPEIFNSSIHFNIDCGIGYSRTEIDRALAISRFDRVLSRLPRGLDTDIREKGLNLSGGEKQRLALARGLLAARDCALLLLDEPTSSVDMGTEMEIFKGILNEYDDTCIVCSVHRMHLVALFDRVVRMGAGEGERMRG